MPLELGELDSRRTLPYPSLETPDVTGPIPHQRSNLKHDLLQHSLRLRWAGVLAPPDVFERYGETAMARCQYCGQPAGFGTEEHAECHDRHQRAIEQIPGFFAKILEHPIAVDRFSALLQSAAEASFIDSIQLKSLAVEGLSRLMITILDHRLLTAAEVERVREVVSELSSLFADEPGLDETLTKIQILCELSNGIIPDQIAVDDPMPITLRRGETILWIFNEVRPCQKGLQEDNAPPSIAVPSGSATYQGLSVFKKHLPVGKERANDKIGDLLLTSHNLYFLSMTGRSIRIPIARISEIHPYINGVRIHYRPAPRSWVGAVADPWFLTNALTLLVQRARGNSA